MVRIGRLPAVDLHLELAERHRLRAVGISLAVNCPCQQTGSGDRDRHLVCFLRNDAKWDKASALRPGLIEAQSIGLKIPPLHKQAGIRRKIQIRRLSEGDHVELKGPIVAEVTRSRTQHCSEVESGAPG